MITKEELTKMLVDYHAVPYRNRESAAQELVEEIWEPLKEHFLQELEDSLFRAVRCHKRIW